MLVVAGLLFIGITLLALASNKHFKLVAFKLSRTKNKVLVQKAMAASGWIVVMLSLVATIYAAMSSSMPISIALVWWFSLMAAAILGVALVISEKSTR